MGWSFHGCLASSPAFSVHRRSGGQLLLRPQSWPSLWGPLAPCPSPLAQAGGRSGSDTFCISCVTQLFQEGNVRAVRREV